MLAQERIIAASTHPAVRSLHSNEPIMLDHPDQIWVVQSGSLALFAIVLENGITKGRRRYLFNVKADEILFASSAQQTSNQCQILAVALEPTELQPVSCTEFRDRILTAPYRTISELESWIYRLSAALSGMAAPTLSTPIESEGILEGGEVFQPAQGAIAWMQIRQGRGHILGMAGLEVTAASGRIPINTHLWVRASDRVEIHSISKEKISDATQLFNGFLTAQTLILTGLYHLTQQELQQEFQRTQELKKLNQRVVTETLGEFKSLFQPSPRNSYRTNTPVAQTSDAALLMATGAVGRALGITISPPAASEDRRRVRDPLEAIARASQVRVRKVTLREEWWKKDSGALLVYGADDDRPMALLPVSDTQYDVLDPMTQRRVRCTRAIAARISPTAYTFYRPLPPDLKPLHLLRFATRGRHKELGMILFAGIAATLLGMITPKATELLIDSAIPNGDRRLLVQIALGLVATTIGATLFQLTQSVAILRLETFADSSTQAAVWDRLLNLKASFFRQYAIGDLSSRVSAVSQIRQHLSGAILKSLFSSVFSFLNLGLLFYYSLPLAAIALLVALLNIAVTVASGIFTLRKMRPLLDQQGKLFGMMVQLINGVPKFRVAGAENRAFAYWGKQYSHQLKLGLATQGIEDNLTVVNSLLSTLTPAVLFAVATQMLQTSNGNGMSTGTFLAFNAAFGTFISGATSLSSTIVDVLEILPTWERAQPILDAIPEVNPSRSDPGRLSGRITVSNAMFRYRPDGALILNDVSMQAEPGEFIALVGPSGSGKSTLFRLLLGFDVPESGVIAYDGQDLSGIDVNAVRRQFGVVLQNSRVTSASIFENIASSALITMEEAWEAARMAGFADDVSAMPMGMHTVISEGGSNLSGGQRQRLLIARALALKPRILLFDEATSALDNRTQAIVSESLDRLKVTRVVVAHRLSTIRNADRIYVLQQGQVVQQGGFQELAEQPGLFRQLVQRQSL